MHMDSERPWDSPTKAGTAAFRRLWRTVGPGALSPDLAKPLRAAVEAAHLAAGRAYPPPVEGPSAIREARAALARCRLPHPDVDAAVTAVLAFALQGDAAAARFVAEALDRFASVGEGEPHHARFAGAWRERSGHSSGPVGALGNGDAPAFGTSHVAHLEGRPMRLWIFSDLHIDIGGPWAPTPVPSADLAVVAGDIGEGLGRSLSWLSQHVRPHMPVAFVAGNHEFYRRCLPEEVEAARVSAAEAEIHFLENDSVRVGDLSVSGCTLWTDYDLDGPGTREASMQDAGAALADHRLVSWKRAPDRRRFRPEEARALHLASREFLEGAFQQVRKDGTRAHVVVTHHAPSRASVAPRFIGKPLNPAFASGLDNLIEAGRPSLWVHGHTHTCFDYRLGGTRVVCNPRGYPGENPNFRPGLVVEV